MAKVTCILPIWLVNKELANLTSATLNSLNNSLFPEGDEFELIIIDNASPLYSDSLISLKPYIYIRASENKGFPWAVNQGLKIGTGEYFAVLNNDIKVSDNWWLVAKEIFERVKDAGTAHFRMIGYDEPNVPGDQIFPTGKERWCHGSFYVAKKEVFDKVGLYDEGFGLGGYDDYDLFGRIRKAGFKQVYTNGAFFQHKDSSTQLLRDPNERSETDRKNREYYKKKHGKYPDLEFAEQFPKQMEELWRPYP